ncbi:hypothetical protein L249_5046 [Ophiocordyceps polyrhachis-furcata BCC 54312]|uniref:DNA repair protein Rad26 n=1 Tax=Ophiocordyceps polyrhachis-furcata BCC 54312 TaxID=1330021 RepID=A0A367L3V1_9HYPO|nr:hypothetical protein L249_5046 [Ophiocordyceps polyrhachis-furcata BCC 54312]
MDLDDEFSDDGFADLTDHALQELERDAIRLTQAHGQRPSHPVGSDVRLSDYGWEEEDDDLDNAEVVNDVGLFIGRPVVDNSLQKPQNHHAPPLLQSQQPPQQSQQLPRRPLPQMPNPNWNPNIDPASRSVNRPVPSRPPADTPGPTQGSQPRNEVVSALQRRLRALEAELNAARGEASILRANSTKAQHEYHAQITSLKKLNAEQLAKQERAVEAAVAAEKSANTELQFLQRDMREVHDRVRRRDAAVTAAVTPSKASKSWNMADGFDRLDMITSPSKGQQRGRASVAANVGERTPTRGKRKRPVADSPVAALEFHSQDVAMVDEDEMGKEQQQQQQQQSAVPASRPLMCDAAPAAPFEFLQLVLDQGSFHHQPPTFDMLSRFSYPCDPTAASLASIIFEKLPLMGNPQRPMQLLVDFAEHVISLWARCVEEQYWDPVRYLVSLVSFTLDLHTVSVAPLIVASLAPVARATILVLAEGRRRLPEGSPVEEPVDTTQVLSLLYMSALACATTPSKTETGFEYTALGFWRLISLDMVLLLLTPKQKLDDTVGMLDLLATSSLPESIGPVSDEAEAVVVARAVVERVSAKLTEPSRRVRLAALRTLAAFARYPFGALQLASHDNALPRLVACLSAAIDALYDQPTPPSALPPMPDGLASQLHLPEPSAPAELCLIVSRSVLLLHALVTPDATAAADISQKLALAHGGSQRYLIALGRLFFVENLVIEAGIDSEAVEAARELLEMAVTPDEGETISEAFGAGYNS